MSVFYGAHESLRADTLPLGDECGICRLELVEDRNEEIVPAYVCDACLVKFHRQCATHWWNQYNQPSGQLNGFAINNRAAHNCPTCRAPWPSGDFPTAPANGAAVPASESESESESGESESGESESESESEMEVWGPYHEIIENPNYTSEYRLQLADETLEVWPNIDDERGPSGMRAIERAAAMDRVRLVQFFLEAGSRWGEQAEWAAKFYRPGGQVENYFAQLRRERYPLVTWASPVVRAAHD
jgi:hypothetical protein